MTTIKYEKSGNKHKADICTCLHHACKRAPEWDGVCATCRNLTCEVPEYVQETFTPIEPTWKDLTWPASPKCGCGAPWHPSTGHVDFIPGRTMKLYCWRCTLNLIETIKHCDWSNHEKGLRKSGQFRFQGRRLFIKDQKYLPKL